MSVRFAFIPNRSDGSMARPNPSAMAHRTSDLIRALDPETEPEPIRCAFQCGYSAHTREYMTDHYVIAHQVPLLRS